MIKKKSDDKRTILRILAVLIAVFLIAAGMKVYEEVFAANVEAGKGKRILYYHTNAGFDQNFKLITAQQVLKHPSSLKRIIALAGYEDLLKPGRYRLQEGMNNLELMRMLVSGRQEPVDVVLTAAERKHDLAVFWSRNLEADSNSIDALLNSHMIEDSLGLDSFNTILAFIPNTYNFYWNTSATELMKRMISEYRKFWDTTRLKQAAALGLKPEEVGVLASIVQKETHKRDEMPLVAGVYVNRLRKGMPLQADPTILFAINDKSIRRVGGSMLQIPSPYNTYVNKGLPPGPICMPSVQATDAVLNLRHHRYLYFCAKEDFSGYHNFAADFTTHQRNARKYQQALNRKGIK